MVLLDKDENGNIEAYITQEDLEAYDGFKHEPYKSKVEQLGERIMEQFKDEIIRAQTNE